MPELGEDMYCSQQICIPPTFPYMLRQFAKAAIRTQPNDLLKWSTTYFRCLALNIPPPVKPRLEYPIPRDHHGMTPGWLRALLNQMAGNYTVSFKTLWDRWIGACLEHNHLIQILVLGGFDDNTAVPWLRFIGLCAAHLTDNLTQTMILICEILTEEPEGGSAMITVETFLDLYQFLARIDASTNQTLRNYYFLDKFLELFQERIAKDSGIKAEDEGPEEEPSSLISSKSSLKSERESRRDDQRSVVSCPSVTSQDPDNYMRLLMKIRADGEDELYEEESATELKDEKAAPEPTTEEEEGGGGEEEKKDVQETKEGEEPQKEDEDQEAAETATRDSKQEEEEGSVRKPSDDASKRFSQQLAEDEKIEIFPSEQDDVVSQDTQISSADKSADVASQKEGSEKLETDPYLIEDLERLRAVQQELAGETDDELEKFKASVLADAGLTPSQMGAPQHFESKLEEPEVTSSESVKSEVSSSQSSDKGKQPEDEREYEDVYVESVPGIGPKVPEEMIAVVCNYMKEVAMVQHGMVMPRNIRHYECPPLEMIKDYN